MSFFLNKDKTRKTTIALTTFVVTLAFIGIFAIFYVLLTEPLYRFVSLGNETLTTVVHCLVIAVIGTAACCLLFLLKDKRLVPYGFGGLAIALLLCYAMTLFTTPESRATLRMLITLYGLCPVAVGNAVAWPVYWHLRRSYGFPR